MIQKRRRIAAWVGIFCFYAIGGVGRDKACLVSVAQGQDFLGGDKRQGVPCLYVRAFPDPCHCYPTLPNPDARKKTAPPGR